MNEIRADRAADPAVPFTVPIPVPAPLVTAASLARPLAATPANWDGTPAHSSGVRGRWDGKGGFP